MSKKLMLYVSKAFAESDLRPLLEALDERIVWKSATSSKSDEIRFGGVHVGIVEVKKLLATVAADYKFHRFEPIEIVENGEIVWGLFDAVIEHTTTKKLVTFEFAVRWRVRNGKVVEHRGFFDTALVMQAARRSSEEKPE